MGFDDDFDFDNDDFGFDGFDDGADDDLRGGLDDFGDTDDGGDGFGDFDEFEDEDLDMDDFGNLAMAVDDDFEFEPEEEEESGTNRTFIILAGVMIVLFIVGLVAVLILAGRTPPEQIAFAETSTAVAIYNFTQEAFLEMTQTAAPLTQTAQAEMVVAQGTQTAEAATQMAIETIAAQTQAAADIAITQTADALALTQAAADTALTLTAQAQPVETEPVETPEVEETIDMQQAVALTATKLFLDLQVQATPTREIDDGTGGGDITAVPQTALPDTGLLDDIFGGGQSFGAFILMAFGLVGVIVVSRRLRSNSNT